MSVVVVAYVYPEPEHRDEVIAVLEHAVGRVHAEDEGCELYALHEADDGRLVFVEKWASAEALGAHAGAAPLAEANEKLAGKTTKPADVLVLTPHPAGEAAKGAL
jgi:quinol monooxygenase YgiN